MNPLYQRFADTAARRPEALAIQAGDQPGALALTHRQFLALADAQAARWQAQGLGAGHCIGWLGHNSAAMLAGLLACAKLANEVCLEFPSNLANMSTYTVLIFGQSIARC